MTSSPKKSFNFRNINECKKTNNNLMIGYPAKLKEDLEIENLNISIENVLQLSGINIIACIIVKMIHHQKLFRDINSISSIRISTISKKLLNTICKPQKVPIIASLNLKQVLPIKILLSKF